GFVLQSCSITLPAAHAIYHIETVDQGQVGAVEPAPDGADADDGKNRENDVDDGEQHQQMGSEGCLNVVTGGRIQWSSPSRYSQRDRKSKRLNYSQEKISYY